MHKNEHLNSKLLQLSEGLSSMHNACAFVVVDGEEDARNKCNRVAFKMDLGGAKLDFSRPTC